MMSLCYIREVKYNLGHPTQLPRFHGYRYYDLNSAQFYLGSATGIHHHFPFFLLGYLVV